MYLDSKAILSAIDAHGTWKGKHASLVLVDAFCKAITEHGGKYKLDSPERISAFVGQCIVETMGFMYFGEKGYIKNTGKRIAQLKQKFYWPHFGRGPIQTTGNGQLNSKGQGVGYNYDAVSIVIFGDKRAGNNPALLDDPYTATIASMVWWAKSKAPSSADTSSYTAINTAVNRYDTDTFSKRTKAMKDTATVFKKLQYDVKYKGDTHARKQTLWQYLTILTKFAKNG
jgi:predicted chitinase